MKIAINAASGNGKFQWTVFDERLPESDSGTAVARECKCPAEACSIGDRDFWFEKYKVKEGGKVLLRERPRKIDPDEIAAHCRGSQGCVERAFLATDSICMKTVDVVDGGPDADDKEIPHVHTDQCPRSKTVLEDLQKEMDKRFKIVADRIEDVDLLAKPATPEAAPGGPDAKPTA